MQIQPLLIKSRLFAAAACWRSVEGKKHLPEKLIITGNCICFSGKIADRGREQLTLSLSVFM